MSVHEPAPHDSALLHVTGAARYTDDIPAPAGCLHLAFGLSPVARGRLAALDLGPVRAAPGVVAALAHGDLRRPADVAPVAHDEPLLCDGAIHYLGQPLFVVAATSHRAARRAARLARVEAEEEAPVLTIDDALAAGWRFEEGPRIWQKGDPDAALATAPRRVRGRLEIGGQEHFYLEGQAALAIPGDDGMEVHCSTQHPSEIQHKVADALGLPSAAVRVVVRRMGGGFGGKESQGNHLAVACAVMAEATGRPCRMRYDRDDDMTITGKRHDFRIDYDAGFDAEGRLLAMEVVQYARCGWSQDLSLAVCDRAMLHADNAYLVPHARIVSHRLRTNTQSATAFRGFGGPQGMLGTERLIQHAAHALGLDPGAVRRLNFYPPATGGERSGPGTGTRLRAVHSPALDRSTPYGMEVEDFILHEMTDALLASSDFADRQRAVREWNSGNPVLKRGLAWSPVKFGISFTLSHLNQAGALVHVYRDGSVLLNHGGTEMGQGLHRKVSQVAAARLGIPLDRVRIAATDTARVPNTSATAASSGADLNGMAVQAAADAIRERMARHLAALHQARAEEVVFADGTVRVGADAMSWEEAVDACYLGRVSLSATGFYATPGLEWDRVRGRGRPFFYFAYGCAATEVVLDTLTGESRILRADILHDCGASLNPALDIGQIEGGYVQGAGWLTTEELVWDAKGRLRTHAPATYKIPAFSDRPAIFNVRLWDAANRAETVYRSKAVGEPPLMLGISAFLALSEACAACGPHWPDLQAPATPEAILRAVARARGA
ncbi:xanthine dehydrogenase molybdopterin binding subunit [Rubellimicrobium sp. CFH 75288]|uniref:xanthine dehydrogenase molybdopterin binding subunit n=1 Tax=Rubellimicrobium sp. CFH 75288 TaxID=2697034 RepID=UPI001412A21F|nr:xanthine dehydrogenase molybdopterin binding subunit [Rubellimicrobium sp. CFH 75288]NAZ37065.1 xanthine dehydrogenase molybdopterin binding subunit [Rubellimicrobium sp. CFH 75288]